MRDLYKFMTCLVTSWSLGRAGGLCESQGAMGEQPGLELCWRNATWTESWEAASGPTQWQWQPQRNLKLQGICADFIGF